MAGKLGEGVFMNIPTPLITDILSRLPPKTILQCRCVCKGWLKLLSEPEFVDLHLSKSPTCLIVHKVSSSPPRSASFSLVKFEDETDHHGITRITGMDMEIPRSRRNVGVTVIGSVHGLVCINEFAVHYKVIRVWNPIIREFITIKMPGGDQKHPNITTYGFGMSSGMYHVVRIFQEIEITHSDTIERRIRDSVCHVYTVGTGVWRYIGHAPYLYSSSEHGLFFNGNLHWLIYDQDGPEEICCLNLKKELFQPFPPPPDRCRRHLSTLNLYKSCLSLCDNASDFDIVIWVMKEYGVGSSWSKEVVISKHLIDRVGDYYEVVRIIKVFKDGEILLLWRDDKLFSYHPERKTVQDLDINETMTGPPYLQTIGSRDKSYPCIEAMDYVSTFVSPKMVGENNVKKR